MDEPTPLTIEVNGTLIAARHHHSGGSGRAPAIVLCTGFGGTQDTPAIMAAAAAFAAAGVHAVTFDYRSFGTSGGTPRQVVSVPSQLDDVRAVLRHVRSLPSVDPGRVALWGSSLGGGHVLSVAAEDPGLAAVIAQVPFNGFPRHVEGRSTRATLTLLGAILEDRVRGWLRLSPRYVQAIGAPGELAMMTGPELPAVATSLGGSTWLNEVAPRGALDMMSYRPGHTAHRISCPLLVCVATRDIETAAATTESLARSAPRGQQIGYDGTHFDVYGPGLREQILRDQVAFLRETLDPRKSR